MAGEIHPQYPPVSRDLQIVVRVLQVASSAAAQVEDALWSVAFIVDGERELRDLPDLDCLDLGFQRETDWRCGRTFVV